jgi:hypothetical protein
MLQFLYFGSVTVPDLDAAIALGRLADLYELSALRSAVLVAARAAAAARPAAALATIAAARGVGLLDLEADCWEKLCESFPAICVTAGCPVGGIMGGRRLVESDSNDESVLFAMSETILAEYLSMVCRV